MISLEGIIRELFFRPGVWKKILWGSFLSYVLLCFGYLRSSAKYFSQSVEIELPEFKFDKSMAKLAFSVLPLGSFYFLVPLFLAWSVAHLLHLVNMDYLAPLPWGIGTIMSLTLASVALVCVPDDEERFFLGLEFEKVLVEWWKNKRFWAFPALACYGLIAALGWPFYGFSFFVSMSFLVAYLALTLRNQRYS